MASIQLQGKIFITGEIETLRRDYTSVVMQVS